MTNVFDVNVAKSLDRVSVRMHGKEHHVANVGLMRKYLGLVKELEAIDEFDVDRDRASYPERVREIYRCVLNFLQTLLPRAPEESLRQMAYVQVLFLLKDLVAKMEPTEEDSGKKATILPFENEGLPHTSEVCSKNRPAGRILSVSSPLGEEMGV